MITILYLVDPSLVNAMVPFDSNSRMEYVNYVGLHEKHEVVERVHHAST